MYLIFIWSKSIGNLLLFIIVDFYIKFISNHLVLLSLEVSSLRILVTLQYLTILFIIHVAMNLINVFISSFYRIWVPFKALYSILFLLILTSECFAIISLIFENEFIFIFCHLPISVIFNLSKFENLINLEILCSKSHYLILRILI